MDDSLWYAPIEDTASSGGSSGSVINWSGFGSTLTDLAKVYGGIEVAKNQPQRGIYALGPNGQPYYEGQRIQQGGLSPLLVLLIVGGLIYAAAK